MSFSTKSMMLYSIVLPFYQLSRTFFETGKLTVPLSTKWHCEKFQAYLIAQNHFTISRHHFYIYSCNRSAFKSWDFSRNCIIYVISATEAVLILSTMSRILRYCKAFNIRDLSCKSIDEQR